MPPDCAADKTCHLADDAARRAAKEAVALVFAIVGVDVDDPRQVEEFREDLRFGRRMRRVADKGAMAVVGAVAVAIAGALLIGIQTKMGVK